MNTINNGANFNGQMAVIDRDDAVLLLIDHQSGLFQTVKDMEMTALRANAATLAKVATLAKIPVITSASVPQGPNGPLIPEIHKYAPHAQYVARRGQINAWDNPDFVAAVKATGRTTLINSRTHRSSRCGTDRHRRCVFRDPTDVEPSGRCAVGRSLQRVVPALSAADRELLEGTRSGDTARTAGLCAPQAHVGRQDGVPMMI